MPVTDDPNDPCIQNIEEDGQQTCYLVLSDEERAKGFVRPVRTNYIHAESLGGCGTVTTMGLAIAETYARNPAFYGGTFCVGCGGHFSVGENGQFYWIESAYPGSVIGGASSEKVGT